MKAISWAVLGCQLLALIFAMAGTALAQQPPIQWTWQSETPGFQSITGLAARDGRLVAVGSNRGDDTTGHIVGVNEAGEQFMNYFPAFDELRTQTSDVAILTDGRIAMSMEQFYPGEPTIGYVVLYGADGSQSGLSEPIVLPPMSQTNTSLMALADGGFLLAKSYAPEGTTALDALIIRYNATGTRVGDFLFDGPEDRGISQLVPLSDDRFLIVGWNGTTEEEHHWAAVLDLDGSVVWDRQYEGFGRLTAAAVRPDGSFMLAGFVTLGRDRTMGTVDFVDQDGEQYSQVTLDDAWSSSIRSVETLPDGGLAFAGYITPAEDGHEMAFMTRMDEERQVLWYIGLAGHPRASAFNDIAVLQDGGLAVGGYIRIDGNVETSTVDGRVMLRETEPEVLGVDGLILRFAPDL
ncbi:MAG: hypothetical protein AAF414_18090 [Pseudomonadota bacterium]